MGGWMGWGGLDGLNLGIKRHNWEGLEGNGATGTLFEDDI